MTIREFHPSVVQTLPIGESAGRRRYRAKVAHADRPTLNGRVYPRDVLESNIRRLRPLLGKGELTGAVGHQYADDAALANKCVVHRDLTIDADGSVYSDFELVEGHSKAADIRALLDTGVPLGFSLFGDGSRRPVTAADRARFGLPRDTAAEVMAPDYQISAIDVVDKPAMPDARVVAESQARPGPRIRAARLAEANDLAGNAALFHQYAGGVRLAIERAVDRDPSFPANREQVEKLVDGTLDEIGAADWRERSELAMTLEFLTAPPQTWDENESAPVFAG